MPKSDDFTCQRRMISDAAITVINESGLEGARLRDVALAANVTTGTAHLLDEAGQPAIAARDEILAFFSQRLSSYAQVQEAVFHH